MRPAGETRDAGMHTPEYHAIMGHPIDIENLTPQDWLWIMIGMLEASKPIFSEFMIPEMYGFYEIFDNVVAGIDSEDKIRTTEDTLIKDAFDSILGVTPDQKHKFVYCSDPSEDNGIFYELNLVITEGAQLMLIEIWYKEGLGKQIVQKIKITPQMPTELGSGCSPEFTEQVLPLLEGSAAGKHFLDYSIDSLKRGMRTMKRNMKRFLDISARLGIQI